jgi:hypothetical protein
LTRVTRHRRHGRSRLEHFSAFHAGIELPIL